MAQPPGQLATGPVRWWAPSESPAGDLRDTLDEIVRLVSSGQVRNRKRGRRKELYVLWPGTPREVLVKVNRYRGASAPWRRLRRSKARRELALSLRAAAAGVPVPVPLAAGEERRGLLLERCWLVVPAIRPSRDLAEFACSERVPSAERRRLATELGKLVAGLLRARILQDDLAPNNVLVVEDGAPRLLAIDFERARAVRRIHHWQVVRMLAKLERRCGFASRTDRLRFLHAVVGGDREIAHRLWRDVECEMPRWFRRDVRRLERQLSRRPAPFERIERGATRALVDPGLDPEEVARWILETEGRGPPTAPGRACAPTRRPVCRLPASRARRLERELAAALALHERGLAPQVLGALAGPAGGLLVYTAEPRTPRSPLRPKIQDEAARIALSRRLGALGARPIPLPPESYVEIRSLGAASRLGTLDPRPVTARCQIPQRRELPGASSRG